MANAKYVHVYIGCMWIQVNLLNGGALLNPSICDNATGSTRLSTSPHPCICVPDTGECRSSLGKKRGERLPMGRGGKALLRAKPVWISGYSELSR